MKLRETVPWLMGTLPRHLFPRLEECWERSLTDKEQQLVSILELVHIEKFVASSSPRRCGRKRHDRRALARAFVAKVVYNHPFICFTREAVLTSRGLRRICGYGRRCDTLSESVFSRAFTEFAEMRLDDKVHEAMVEKFVKAGLVGHISQVAIPLMKTTSERVDYLYNLMDAAFDAQSIYEVGRSLGHVPIIDRNSRGKDIVPLAPHEAVRDRESSVAERFNSRLKEDFGAGNVMVRGAKKIRLHLLFGLIAPFADQLLKLIN
jgi:hypothetical protein